MGSGARAHLRRGSSAGTRNRRRAEANGTDPASPASPQATEAVLPTRRERKITELIAHGYTDRQIAETLFLAAGTVAWHVHHILQNLDLQSRRQIAERIQAQESLPPSSRPNYTY
jgi:DNA-binding NarL/FixJ family response regulator